MDKKEMMIVAPRENSKKQTISEKLNAKLKEWINRNEQLSKLAKYSKDHSLNSYSLLFNICTGFKSLCNTFTRLVFIAFLINVIGQYCPEVATKFPVIFQFYNGVLEVFNFMLITSLKGLKTLCSFNLSEIIAFPFEVIQNFIALLSQFLNWISNITF